jgi:hypothetical protein
MAEKCLQLIKNYHKGSRTPLDKAAAIRNITAMLTSGSSQQFLESEMNDALGSYLQIIEEHDKSIVAIESRSATADEQGTGSK